MIAGLASGAVRCSEGPRDTVVRAASPSPAEALANPDGSWKYTNALVHEISPYLLLHAHNPVAWHPWGPEALAQARRENKPIFLSVGYSTCYWCHVMERLVFADPEIAALMNEWFVNIKVDREERPDLDRIYMTATLMVSGHGGWPNSVFLTPDLQPFFAGTYFPPEEANGRPGFPSLLEALHRAWEERPAEVRDMAVQMAAALRGHLEAERGAPMEPDTVLVNRALSAVEGRYDATYGGFEGPPKFPPYVRLEFLLDAWEREPDPARLALVRHTLTAMAHGGIYDQVGGGFHRYATDAEWQIPHFEKMLYSQAHLAHLYLRAHKATGEEVWRRMAEDIFRFVRREMRDPAGAFYSALDAETESVEGKHYLWTEEELLAVLGDDAELFSEIYELAPMPEGEAGVVYMWRSPEDAAADLEVEIPELARRVEEVRGTLLDHRSTRARPLLDDKILTSWNGMMIAALALGHEALGTPAYARDAEAAADFVLRRMRAPGGGLRRVYRQGVLKHQAYLEDYAWMARGLLGLFRATGERRRLAEAREIVDQMLARFWDEEDKGFFYTEGGEDLIARIKNGQDSALPAANAVAVHCLLDLARATGDQVYLERARETLRAFGGMMHASPTAFTHMIAAAWKCLGTSAAEGQPRLARADSPYPGAGLAIPGSAGVTRPDPAALQAPLQAQVRLSAARPAPGQAFQVALLLDIRDGWHINGNPASSDMLVPTSLGINADLPLELVAVSYPGAEPLYFPAMGETLQVYHGQVTLRADVRLKLQARAGERGQMRVLLRYQACRDGECLTPVELVEEVDLEVAAAEVVPPLGGRRIRPASSVR